MEAIGEALILLLSEPTFEAAIEEIITLLRPSTTEANADTSSFESKKSALKEKLASFTRLSRTLLAHDDEVKRILDDLEEQALKIEDELVELELPDITPPLLIHFVDVMDQVNQYFDFKELAKLSCCNFKSTLSPTKIYDFLLLNQQLLSEFSKIDGPEVRRAANAIFWELSHEQRGKKDTKPKMDPALLDPIHKLVYETRVKGYDMDQDPITQLKKMMKSQPYFYEKYFFSQKLPVECTERAIQDARDKYSQLLRVMSAKYKEASSEKHKVTPSPTSVGNKLAFNEKHELTSTAFNANEKGFSEKRAFITTGAVDMLPHKQKRDH